MNGADNVIMDASPAWLLIVSGTEHWNIMFAVHDSERYGEHGCMCQEKTGRYVYDQYSGFGSAASLMKGADSLIMEASPAVLLIVSWMESWDVMIADPASERYGKHAVRVGEDWQICI